MSLTMANIGDGRFVGAAGPGCAYEQATQPVAGLRPARAVARGRVIVWVAAGRVNSVAGRRNVRVTSRPSGYRLISDVVMPGLRAFLDSPRPSSVHCRPQFRRRT